MDISVVVCTYNRQKQLRNILESLIHQETMGQFAFEIVVIDDGSTDHTRDVVKSIAENSSAIAVKYFYKQGDGVAKARNRGIKEATGNWIAFIDDDEWAERDWLAELYEAATRNGADCVGGAVVLDLPSSIEKPLSIYCRALLGEVLSSQKPASCPANLLSTTANVMIHQKVFAKIGMFNTRMLYGCTDTDFFWRASNEGVNAFYAPKAVVHHVVPEARLQEKHLKDVSLKSGVGDAWVRYKHRSRLRCFLALCRRLFRSFTRDLLLLLIAYIFGNAAQVIDRRCRLWMALGYVRGSLSFLLPKLFPQKSFFDSLQFRKRGTKLDSKPRGEELEYGSQSRY